MGGGSRSSASTTNTTQQIDARSVVDNSNNQGVIAGAGATANSHNTTTVYSTDAGAVRAALDFADNLGGEALRAGVDALTDANRTTRDTTDAALSFAGSAQRGAFDFADTFAGLALDLVGDASGRVQSTASNALATVERAYTDAKGEGIAARYAVFGALAVAALAVGATIMRSR